MNYEAVRGAVRAYAATRAKELLAEQAFHVPELEILILDELRASVRLGVTDYTIPPPTSKQLHPNEQMRLELWTPKNGP